MQTDEDHEECCLQGLCLGDSNARFEQSAFPTVSWSFSQPAALNIEIKKLAMERKIGQKLKSSSSKIK